MKKIKSLVNAAMTAVLGDSDTVWSFEWKGDYAVVMVCCPLAAVDLIEKALDAVSEKTGVVIGLSHRGA